jgi:two-component system sensor histidine kinase HydH
VASAEVSGEQLTFRVVDAGSGITPGDEERVFEPFVTARTRWVGLGLAITRRIAELHGGRARAVNRPGGGAELILIFPRRS